MDYHDTDDSDAGYADPDEKEEKARAKRVAKWKTQATHLQATALKVCILTLEDIAHENCHIPKTRLIGVYDSKDATVAASINVESEYGRFDKAIKDIFCEQPARLRRQQRKHSG